jgi:hypothetical protein
MSELSCDRVREVLDYNFETGQFTWRVKRTRVRVGDTAGYFDNGYRKIRIDGANYHASRLAFLWMTGKFPQGEVDHIDHNTKNNCWSNLRKATRQENQRNRTVRDDSSTGFKGVRFQRSAHGNQCGYYVATIGVNGKRLYLGSFKTAEEASEAYRKAAAEHHGEFART